MACARCGAELEPTAKYWCVDCERAYDTWVRQYAADILWQTFPGAGLAIAIALGLPVLGFSPLVGLVGVVAGATTFFTLRRWGMRRRRQQFLATALPRAYLPGET